MPDITPTPQQDAIAAFLQSCRELGAALDRIAERFRLERERLASASHLAAAGSEPAVGWSAKAKAALELWEAHSETIAALARTKGWGALTAEERGAGIAAQTAIQLSDRIADAVTAGVLDLIKGWAAVEDESARDTFSRETEDGWGDTAITPKGSGESAWTEAEDLPWLRLALDHAILNDPDTRFLANTTFAPCVSGSKEWVRVEDAARIAANWIVQNRTKVDLSNGCPTCGGPGEMRVNREADPGKERCTNCEHQMQFHQPDGCWFGMRARVGRNSACPCGVGRGESGDGCICGRKEGEPGFGLLCPVHGDPISRKNLPREESWDLTEQARQKLAELHHAAGRASAAIVEQTRQVLREHAATAPRDEDGKYVAAVDPAAGEEAEPLLAHIAADGVISIERNRDWWPLRTRHLDGSHNEWGDSTAELLQRMWVLINIFQTGGFPQGWHDTMAEVAYAYDQWRNSNQADTHIITAWPLTLGQKPKPEIRDDEGWVVEAEIQCGYPSPGQMAGRARYCTRPEGHYIGWQAGMDTEMLDHYEEDEGIRHVWRTEGDQEGND